MLPVPLLYVPVLLVPLLLVPLLLVPLLHVPLLPYACYLCPYYMYPYYVYPYYLYPYYMYLSLPGWRLPTQRYFLLTTTYYFLLSTYYLLLTIYYLLQAGAFLLNAHSSSPICQPSRWSLLTGRYASAGTFNRSSNVFFQQRPPSASETAAGMLRQHGWRCYSLLTTHYSLLTTPTACYLLLVT